MVETTSRIKDDGGNCAGPRQGKPTNKDFANLCLTVWSRRQINKYSFHYLKKKPFPDMKGLRYLAKTASHLPDNSAGIGTLTHDMVRLSRHQRAGPSASLDKS